MWRDFVNDATIINADIIVIITIRKTTHVLKSLVKKILFWRWS